MSAVFTYPGVYVTEKPSGAQAVPAAATSIAMFVGMADRGPFERPTRVQSLAEYARRFGEASEGEMAQQVRQFFVNGGGDAYVMRIAKGAEPSGITIQSESGNAVLEVKAKDVGAAGDLLRVEVDYATSSPERTFNLTVFRSVLNPDGSFARTDTENHANLSMDSEHARFVERVIKPSSALVAVKAQGVPAAASAGGISISGLLLPPTVAAARAALVQVLNGTGNSFTIAIDGRPPVTAAIIKEGLTAGNVESRLRSAIVNAYEQQLLNLNEPEKLKVSLTTLNATLGRVLEISSSLGSVVVSPAATNDCSVKLMLGVAAGGIELDAYSALRPAPSGAFAKLGDAAGNGTTSRLARLVKLAEQPRKNLKAFSLVDPGASDSPYEGDIAIQGAADDAIGLGAVPGAGQALGSFANVGNALDDIAAAINAKTGTRWRAQRVGYRLVLRPAPTLGPSVSSGIELTTHGDAPGSGHDLGADAGFIARNESANVAAYTLGSAGGQGYQVAESPGKDGDPPTLPEYQKAFDIIGSQVEIFNMMVLPRAPDQTSDHRQAIWGAASSFCAQQRAILFVDPDEGWETIEQAEKGADAIKLGVDTRHAIVYWPRVTVPTPAQPSGVNVDPSGSMAGLYARTDARFGTWRAPAGLEATLTGVLGLEVRMSDAENGRINPKALNAIRVFPSGVTAWGARMMVGADATGNVDDKYVNVRRMMLFIENSLYRGLQFAVFRNNAEPLWASIRLAAGAFMHGLMTRGAFASTTKSTAYYVICDETTTTPTDVNLGIVNVLVGFAPNKPAEFVHLTVTQIAGQVEI